jgi:hypothetical protein
VGHVLDLLAQQTDRGAVAHELGGSSAQALLCRNELGIQGRIACRVYCDARQKSSQLAATFRAFGILDLASRSVLEALYGAQSRRGFEAQGAQIGEKLQCVQFADLVAPERQRSKQRFYDALEGARVIRMFEAELLLIGASADPVARQCLPIAVQASRE